MGQYSQAGQYPQAFLIFPCMNNVLSTDMKGYNADVGWGGEGRGEVQSDTQRNKATQTYLVITTE